MTTFDHSGPFWRSAKGYSQCLHGLGDVVVAAALHLVGADGFHARAVAGEFLRQGFFQPTCYGDLIQVGVAGGRGSEGAARGSTEQQGAALRDQGTWHGRDLRNW